MIRKKIRQSVDEHLRLFSSICFETARARLNGKETRCDEKNYNKDTGKSKKILIIEDLSFEREITAIGRPAVAYTMLNNKEMNTIDCL